MASKSAERISQQATKSIDQAQKSLKLLHGEMEHVHRLATLGTLAAGIAHEINNLLTPVLGYAQMAKADPGDSKLQAKALERAIAGVEATAKIAEAMLGFARPGQQVSGANVLEVLESAISCLARTPSKDGIDLQINIDPQLCVNMPPISLQQVLINLLLNSTKAMAGKPGRIVISSSISSDGFAEISVMDSGPGIPQEISQTLFEPFVSMNKAGSESTGTGLGLAICKELIEAAGGTISVQSQPNQGTTFTLRLQQAEVVASPVGKIHDHSSTDAKAA